MEQEVVQCYVDILTNFVNLEPTSENHVEQGYSSIIDLPLRVYTNDWTYIGYIPNNYIYFYVTCINVEAGGIGIFIAWSVQTLLL